MELFYCWIIIMFAQTISVPPLGKLKLRQEKVKKIKKDNITLLRDYISGFMKKNETKKYNAMDHDLELQNISIWKNM